MAQLPNLSPQDSLGVGDSVHTLVQPYYLILVEICCGGIKSFDNAE